jgi:hypothetical protein
VPTGSHRADKIDQGKEIELPKRARPGEIIYARDIGNRARLEIRAEWDKTGFIRRVSWWGGHDHPPFFRANLGFVERIKMACGICPELDIYFRETFALLDAAEDELSGYGSYPDVMELAAQIVKGMDHAGR